MPTHSEDERPITFINVFDISEDEIDEFIARWERRSRLMTAADGFISAELHRAADADTEFRVVNVAKWTSRAHFEAAIKAPQFRAELEADSTAPASTWTAHRGIYRTAAKLVGKAADEPSDP